MFNWGELYVLLTLRGGKMAELTKKIGERVRELRNAKGLTQEELAFQASLNDRYIGNIERGEKNVTLDSIEKVTKALDVSLGEFFSLVDPKIDQGNNVLIELIDLLKDRSINEQTDFLNIIKTVAEVLDRK